MRQVRGMFNDLGQSIYIFIHTCVFVLNTHIYNIYIYMCIVYTCSNPKRDSSTYFITTFQQDSTVRSFWGIAMYKVRCSREVVMDGLIGLATNTQFFHLEISGYSKLAPFWKNNDFKCNALRQKAAILCHHLWQHFFITIGCGNLKKRFNNFQLDLDGAVVLQENRLDVESLRMFLFFQP